MLDVLDSGGQTLPLTLPYDLAQFARVFFPLDYIANHAALGSVQPFLRREVWVCAYAEDCSLPSEEYYFGWE